MINKLKEIQVQLFYKELQLLRKGKPYKNYSYDLSNVIDSICYCKDNIIEYYVDYYTNKLYNFK